MAARPVPEPRPTHHIQFPPINHSQLDEHSDYL